MISIISPAKSLDFKNLSSVSEGEEPQFYSKSQQLLQLCKKLSVSQIKTSMNISDSLAALNYERFKGFENQPKKPAIFAYDGDVYTHIERQNLTASQIDFMQAHIGIISGLYGFLRPLDNIKPYRLEMSIKLNGMDLSRFWSSIVTNYINQTLAEHKNKYLINLASLEYSAAIDKGLLKYPFINLHFKENRKGQLKTIALNAKKARGMMASFIIKNLIDLPQELKQFKEAGYHFSKPESSEADWVFIR